MSKYATYFNRTFFPFFTGIVFSENDYNAEMKRLGLENNSFPFMNPGANATFHTIPRSNQNTLLLICIDAKSAKKREKNAVIGLLVHEISHMVDRIFENIGEHTPGSETKAYLLQYLTQEALEAFDNWKPKK